jgi:hypothetical protein
LWDVFISYASEDKDTIARPLAEALQNRGLQVWFDEYTLKIGDSLRKTIDHGLGSSMYGIVLLSKSFFAKDWPQKELDGLETRERNGKKVILPIWHDLTKEEVEFFSPMLAGRLAAKTSDGMDNVVDMIMDVFGDDDYNKPLKKIAPETHPLYPIDKICMKKIKEIGDWIPPTTKVIGEAATSGDYLKMGINAALLKTYIDQNLPEIKRLAKKTITKRAVAQEFIEALEALRTSSEFFMKASDKFNSGDIDESTQLMLDGREYTKKATAHIDRINAIW